MKENFWNRVRLAAGLLALLAFALPGMAPAQVVTQLPVYINNSGTGTGALPVADLGNGPLELRILQGNANLWTAQGAGVGSTSGSSTTLTLTGTPTTPPCVGCIIAGAGITSGTTVAAFNGTTGITLSAAMTVANNTPVQWGAACPTTNAGAAAAAPQMQVQAGQTFGDVPLYTQARICASALNNTGALVLPFPIGAH